jgi:hypothetical protein
MLANLSHIVASTFKGFENRSIAISVFVEIPSQRPGHGPSLHLGDFTQALVCVHFALHRIHKCI